MKSPNEFGVRPTEEIIMLNLMACLVLIGVEVRPMLFTGMHFSYSGLAA